MTLYSVDVYSGSSDNIIRDPHAQAVIVKATQGTGYVNPRCNHQWDLAGSLGKLRGLYHYAGGGNPVAEADYFVNNIKNYVGQGILILDWESYQNASWGNASWARQFVDEVHRLTGVWCVLYVQESALWQVANCARDCIAWVAKYASMNWNLWTVPNMSVSSGAFGALGGWQFTGGDMDRSIWYLDATSWSHVAKGTATPAAQTLTSAGCLDGWSFNGDQLTFSGWFADNGVKGKQYRYMILLDEKNNELARQAATAVQRDDVQKVYPHIDGSALSGFKATFKFERKLVRKLKVLFRYTDDPAGNGHFVDHGFSADLSVSHAYQDSVGVTLFADKLNVSGWFATDASVDLDKRFAILWDTTAKKELARVPATTVERKDVGSKYGNIYNAGQSGFSASLPYDGSAVGHKLQVIFRYSDDDHGEGHRVDYWFDPFAGPAMPVVDGKTETSVLVHSFTAESKGDKTQLTFK